MSDTPRTDALENRWENPSRQAREAYHLARDLELELSETKQKISELEDEISQLRNANIELTQTLNNIVRK